MSPSTKPSITVLHTKLNRPGVTKDLVVRPRLLAQLNAGLEGALTLVIAPAGFGKTTLVSSWLQSATGDNSLPMPSCWLSLDEGDGERDVFLRYFIAALRVIFPEACPETLRLITARQKPPARVILTTLSNEIETLPDRFVVVLDDLHAPHGRALFEFLNDWLRHWPRQMHVVLISRFNPPLPLTLLRVKGLLTEIRARDLRFSEAEASEYFNHVLGAPSDEAAITLLQQRLDGWIAGLKMASMSLDDPERVRDLTAALLDNELFITDYLTDEVIARQPEKIQRFLLKTSILDQFSASLAESLMDEHDIDCNARECMDFIESADLFFIPLDKQRQWYRYHPLFQDVLRQRLTTVMSAAQIEAMNLRAAGWFFAHGLSDQAIRHALAANDLQLAASYMEQGLCDVLNGEDRSVLERWLRMLPEAFITESPWLLIMRGFLHGFRWEIGLLAQATQLAKSLLDKSDLSDRTQILLGLIGVLEGTVYFDTNQYNQVVPCCQIALSNLPAEWQYARGVAASYMGMSLHASGLPEAAQEFLIGQYKSYRDKGDGYSLRLLLAVAVNHIQSGNYENAERAARLLLQQAEQSHLPVMRGWGYYLLGFVNYEWNELEKAADYFGRVVDIFFLTQLAAARNGIIGQAWTAQALGHRGEALQLIDKLSEYDLESGGYEQVDTTSARARLLFLSDNTGAAERLIHLDTFQLLDQSLLIWMVQPHLAKVRVLLARHNVADTKIAIQILDTIGPLAERTLNIRITIEVLALRALALLNRGNNADARETLIRSVELARQGLFTRTFVDMGPQMQNLLRQIAGHATVSKSVGRILAAFPEAETGAGWAALTSHLLPSTQSGNHDDGDLDESLTQRELEILLLMAEPISLKEIALRMSISYATARRYTINVYGKFGVHSRWEAVNIATRKGIIAPRQSSPIEYR